MNHHRQSSHQLVVLYDGGCPLCSREIAHYRRLAVGLPIDWLDVTQPEAGLGRFGLTRVEAIRRFHVIDRCGTRQLGARAFLALWEELPRYCWLARACRRLGLAPLLEWGYARFADWHFRRRCRAGGNAAPAGPPSP